MSQHPKTEHSTSIAETSSTYSNATTLTPSDHASEASKPKGGVFDRLGRRLSQMGKMGLGEPNRAGRLPEADEMEQKRAMDAKAGQREWESRMSDDLRFGKHERDM